MAEEDNMEEEESPPLLQGGVETPAVARVEEEVLFVVEEDIEGCPAAETVKLGYWVRV